MKTGDMLKLAVVGVVGYALYQAIKSRHSLSPARLEQHTGMAEYNAQKISEYKTTSYQQSLLDPSYNILRSVDNAGKLTSYKINPEDLTPFQRWYVERGYYRVKDDVLKLDIPFIPFV